MIVAHNVIYLGGGGQEPSPRPWPSRPLVNPQLCGYHLCLRTELVQKCRATLNSKSARVAIFRRLFELKCNIVQYITGKGKIRNRFYCSKGEVTMAGALHLRYALACAFECILPIKVINSFQSIVLILTYSPFVEVNMDIHFINIQKCACSWLSYL